MTDRAKQLTLCSPDIPYKNERRSNPPLRGIVLVVAAYMYVAARSLQGLRKW